MSVWCADSGLVTYYSEHGDEMEVADCVECSEHSGVKPTGRENEMEFDCRLANALTIAGISENQQEAIFLHLRSVDPPSETCGTCKHKKTGIMSSNFCYRKHEGREGIDICEGLPACDKYEV